jgi:hypothetical protein
VAKTWPAFRSLWRESGINSRTEVDVQLGRDRDRYDDRRCNDYTVGIGPGGISVGSRGPLTKLLRSGTHATFLRFSKASIISITSLIPKDG